MSKAFFFCVLGRDYLKKRLLLQPVLIIWFQVITIKLYFFLSHWPVLDFINHFCSSSQFWSSSIHHSLLFYSEIISYLNSPSLMVLYSIWTLLNWKYISGICLSLEGSFLKCSHIHISFWMSNGQLKHKSETELWNQPSVSEVYPFQKLGSKIHSVVLL